MARTTYAKGKCEFCGKESSKGGMITHLKSCKERKTTPIEGDAPRGSLAISAWSKWDPDYRVIMNVPLNATLYAIDRHLREIWFDPSDHCSAFKIQETGYGTSPYGNDLDGAESMDTEIGKILRPAMEFEYVYDFGTKSYVKLRVGAPTSGSEDSGICELARNEPPDIVCAHCKERRAKWIERERMYEGLKAVYCTPCALEFAKNVLGESEYEDCKKYGNNTAIAEAGYSALSNSPRTWQEPWDVKGDLLDLPDTL